MASVAQPRIMNKEIAIACCAAAFNGSGINQRTSGRPTAGSQRAQEPICEWRLGRIAASRRPVTLALKRTHGIGPSLELSRRGPGLLAALNSGIVLRRIGRSA